MIFLAVVEQKWLCHTLAVVGKRLYNAYDKPALFEHEAREF